MNDTQTKCLRAFNAWLLRWDLDNEEAAERLSEYRKVTVLQIASMREGKICPNIDTFNAWADEINSSPLENKGNHQTEDPDYIYKAFGGIFGNIFKK